LQLVVLDALLIDVELLEEGVVEETAGLVER